MATAMAAKSAQDFIFEWEGKDRTGKLVRGELRAGGEAAVSASMRRQGIMVTKVKKKVYRSGKKVTDKDITLFTRQLATGIVPEGTTLSPRPPWVPESAWLLPRL